MNQVLVEHARILDPLNGIDAIGDIAVRDGLFVRPEALPRGAELRIDAAGCWLLPGLLDIHAHFREPDVGPLPETRQSGALAAARGGFTDVVTMPNTSPAVDTPEAVRFQGRDDVAVAVHPSACCTEGRAGAAVADLEALAAAGAVAFTDDGAMVADDAIMENVLRKAKELGCVVMDHAVMPSLLRGGALRDCAVARRFSLPVFPPEAETAAVARDVALARKAGARLHVQHLSCAESAALVAAAQGDGVAVTAEATPHHLLLAAEDIPGNDANWKMAPPLGTRADVSALRKAVLDGTIACFATDHAPHAPQRKADGFGARSANGVIGLESAVGATLQAMVVESGMAPLDWAACWTTRPAKVVGLPPPSLACGGQARFCIVRPGAVRFEEENIASMSRNSPFVGRLLGGEVLATYRRDRFTWLAQKLERH